MRNDINNLKNAKADGRASPVESPLQDRPLAFPLRFQHGDFGGSPNPLALPTPCRFVVMDPPKLIWEVDPT